MSSAPGVTSASAISKPRLRVCRKTTSKSAGVPTSSIRQFRRKGSRAAPISFGTEASIISSAATGGWRTPFQLLAAVLDELVTAGVLPPERRPEAEYVVWSCVHGLAMLVNQGPLRELAPRVRTHLSELLLAFIARGL